MLAVAVTRSLCWSCRASATAPTMTPLLLPSRLPFRSVQSNSPRHADVVCLNAAGWCGDQDWKTVNPTWLPMLIPESKLCGSNRDARLMVEIYHRRRCAHGLWCPRWTDRLNRHVASAVVVLRDRESHCIVAAVETSLPELLQLSGGRTLPLARIGHVGSVPHRAAVRHSFVFWAGASSRQPHSISPRPRATRKSVGCSG